MLSPKYDGKNTWYWLVFLSPPCNRMSEHVRVLSAFETKREAVEFICSKKHGPVALVEDDTLVLTSESKDITWYHERWRLTSFKSIKRLYPDVDDCCQHNGTFFWCVAMVFGDSIETIKSSIQFETRFSSSPPQLV